MNKLTKLTIKKFRNVAPTTLEFRPGINVLLGKNAAGKTTLLRLLSTAVGVEGNALKDDVMDVSYRAATVALDFEHTLTRTRVNELPLPVNPGRSLLEGSASLQQKDFFVFEKAGEVLLRAEVLPSEVVLERQERQSRFKRIGPMPYFSTLLAFHALTESQMSPEDAELISALLSGAIASAGRMDESLARWEALLGVRAEILGDGPTWSVGGIPASMYEILMAPLPDLTSAAFPLKFLDRVAHVLGYDSAKARFDIERLSPEPNRTMVRLSNLRFFFKRPGEEISHDLLSYGQKRLLAFFAHADASSDIVIADELVNGLHHEWISACLGEIGERQAFLTSQNPLLLDFLRFDSAEEVRRTFILCERENREQGAQLVWRNPTQEEAESFFAAYQTGIQRVSDILLTKGLW